MVTVRLATVSVPLRAGPVLAASAASTWPLPDPVAPLAIVTHGTLLPAVHAQPAAAVTSTRSFEALLPRAKVSGATTNVQAPSWVSANGWVAIRMVAVRPGPVFGSTVNCTAPAPL